MREMSDAAGKVGSGCFAHCPIGRRTSETARAGTFLLLSLIPLPFTLFFFYFFPPSFSSFLPNFDLFFFFFFPPSFSSFLPNFDGGRHPHASPYLTHLAGFP